MADLSSLLIYTLAPLLLCLSFLNKSNSSHLLPAQTVFTVLSFLLILFFLFQSFNNVIHTYNFKTQLFLLPWEMSLNQLSSLQFAVLASGLITSTIFMTILATKPQSMTSSNLLALFVLMGVAVTFVSTDSIFIFFMAFETLLLTSLYLLRLTSKSERVVEASMEMFFWTLVGSLALLTLFTWISLAGIFSFSSFTCEFKSSSVLTLLAIVGFGVKMPVWPFFSWLLKAHVEASVEFSILLSGFIVKLGVFGMAKLFALSFHSAAAPLLFSMSLLGLISASCRLFGQRDLKSMVALTTVIEMNWLGLCLSLGSTVFDNLVAYLIVAHSITTALEFFTVELISKRYGLRDCILVSGLFAKVPMLALASFVVILITMGFPGTPLFLAKLLFLTELASVSWGLVYLTGFILLLVLPVFFIKLWAPMWFGLSANLSNQTYDLSTTELAIFGSLLLTALILSFWPGILLSF